MMNDSLKNCVTPLYFLDSTNGSKEARNYYRSVGNWSKVIFLSFKTEWDDSKVEKLIERTKQRRDYPAFPEKEEDQREKVKKIIPGIEYPGENEKPEIITDPFDPKQLENLALKLFQISFFSPSLILEP